VTSASSGACAGAGTGTRAGAAAAVVVAGAAAVTGTTSGAAACAAAVASVVLVAIAVAVVVPRIVQAAWLDVEPGVFLRGGVLLVDVWADARERADCQYHWDEDAGGDCREAHQDLTHDSLISLLVGPDRLDLAWPWRGWL
jgi:hypothetical protein